MKLIALTSFASREVSAIPGQEFSCSDELAEDLIRAKLAKNIDNKKDASAEVAENEDKSGDDINAVPAAKRKRSRTKSG